jgi:hypothetical protein
MSAELFAASPDRLIVPAAARERLPGASITIAAVAPIADVI